MAGRISCCRDLRGYINLNPMALLTTKRAYFMPFSPALHPYPMSTCIMSPNFFGRRTGFVLILVLSMVATSPRLIAGSRSTEEI